MGGATQEEAVGGATQEGLRRWGQWEGLYRCKVDWIVKLYSIGSNMRCICCPSHRARWGLTMECEHTHTRTLTGSIIWKQ